jgi:Domain of unknown function (DUF6484)
VEGALTLSRAMEGTSPPLARVDSVVIGQLVGFQGDDIPLVTFADQPGTAAVVARTVVDLRGDHIGANVVLQFEGGDPRKPLIMGRLRKPSTWPLSTQPDNVHIDADGNRFVLNAKHEITLRCGKASITLTKAGKVLIQGAYLLSRSSGVNRIKGGSVQIN